MTYSLWYSFGVTIKKKTYDLRFSIASSAATGTPLTNVLSTARSLFAVSSRRCASLSSLSPTAWYGSQPVPKTLRKITHIFYFDDQFCNGKCHFNWIGIDTARHFLEKRLHKPRSQSKMVFPIWDLRLRIRSYSSRSIVAVLFKKCSMSAAKIKRVAAHLEPLTGKG